MVHSRDNVTVKHCWMKIHHLKKIKTLFLGCRSVVQCVLSMFMALRFTPKTRTNEHQ